jgi:hypothetical protein
MRGKCSFKSFYSPFKYKEGTVLRFRFVLKNLSIVTEAPRLIGLKPKEGPSAAETEIWVKGGGFTSKSKPINI